MTNEFYILWFEDNTSWYNMQSRKVKKRLDEDYCLKTNIQRNFGSDLDLDGAVKKHPKKQTGT